MILPFFCFLVFYFLLEIFYFRLADKYNIVDKPNARSSHLEITIRGGGIVFPVAALLPMIFFGAGMHYFFIFGLFLLAVTSFMDDLFDISSTIRFLIQSVAVSLLMLDVGIISTPIFIALFFLGLVAFINGYNFMDGINGMTALYSLVTVITFLWINNVITVLIPNIVFISLLASLFIFSYFNVRKKAKCFSGDVGSVPLAYFICILLFLTYKATGSFSWLALFSVYAIDSGTTILFRLVRGENIFHAHRSHLYQYLANELKLNHLTVSCLYAVVQGVVNITVVLSYQKSPYFVISTLFLLFVIYVIFRLRFEGRSRLFHKY